MYQTNAIVWIILCLSHVQSYPNVYAYCPLRHVASTDRPPNPTESYPTASWQGRPKVDDTTVKDNDLRPDTISFVTFAVRTHVNFENRPRLRPHSRQPLQYELLPLRRKHYHIRIVQYTMVVLMCRLDYATRQSKQEDISLFS
jgi:hypothetical protein